MGPLERHAGAGRRLSGPALAHVPRPRPLPPVLGRGCVPPPPPGPGTCRTCRGPAGTAFDRCWSCSVVGRALGKVAGALPPVVPISVFAPGSPLHRTLVAYKSSPDPAERAACAADLAALVASWLSWHGRCVARLAGGGWDLIDVVPSTRRADPVHPLAAALGVLPALASRVKPLLGRGAAPVGHLDPSPDAFTVQPGAAGARVLLLDDVFTTGAHALSAAASLCRAGATVVAVVPVGRLVHAECRPASEWWARVYAGADGPQTAGVAWPCALERQHRRPRRWPTTPTSCAIWR
jgi:adenine/guanine phosphoribosyltransferase-like PRPP-binding protein